MSIELKGTTICAVKKDGRIAIAGDGQVTMGESVIFKSNARNYQIIRNSTACKKHRKYSKKRKEFFAYEIFLNKSVRI